MRLSREKDGSQTDRQIDRLIDWQPNSILPLLFFTKSLVLREVQRQSYDQLSTEWMNLDPETLCSMINDNQVQSVWQISVHFFVSVTVLLSPTFGLFCHLSLGHFIPLFYPFLIFIWLHLHIKTWLKMIFYYPLFPIISSPTISSHLSLSYRIKAYLIISYLTISYLVILIAMGVKHFTLNFLFISSLWQASLKSVIVSGCFFKRIQLFKIFTCVLLICWFDDNLAKEVCPSQAISNDSYLFN